jgi:hypothetical protein
LRFALLCLVCLLFWGPVWSQSPLVVEIARRSASIALPDLRAADDPTATLLTDVETTALGCKLIGGLPLATPIDVYRLDFPFEDEPFAVHISADGTMAQPCDERFPNLGSGTLPVSRARMDSDGDGLSDGADACPLIAGIYAAERAGCPQQKGGDRDGDGSPDARDRCPDQAGAAAASGCAILRDEDGDGVPDHIDVCLAEFGIIRGDFALGCPADGSGSSTQRREAGDICTISGEAPIYGGRGEEGKITGTFIDAQDRSIIGRAAANDWYQLASGWVRGDGLRLFGACFNIPLVNPAAGGATGCFIRPRADFAKVREAPGGKQVRRIYPNQSVAALGRNINGGWFFYRGGWVNGSVLELAGNCDDLPALDPAKVASGSVHFCPPDYAGLLRPRIDIGEKNARIASDTLANRLRAAPDIAAEEIGEIPPGAILNAVLDGPACKGPYIWWQVEAGGVIGWTAESDVNLNYYYLEPVAATGLMGGDGGDPARQSPSEVERPWSQRIIHSANAAALDTIKLLTIDAPHSVAWSRRGSELAVVTESGLVERYSYPDLAPVLPQVFAGEARRASVIAFSPDARHLAIGDGDGDVSLVDLQSDQSAADALSLGELAGPIRALAWSRVGDKLAAASGEENLKLARRAGALKLWELNPSSLGEQRLLLHYRFPYPLSSLAFSASDRLLAATGESSAEERAGLWIYDVAGGELLLSKALAPGLTRVVTSPDAALGDFVYSNGDSLYQIRVDSGEDLRIYHQAGMLLSHFTFRQQVIPAAEALLATTTIARNGETRLRIANALNSYSPALSLRVAASAIGFSPDGKALAVAEREKDRVLVLGVTQD